MGVPFRVSSDDFFSELPSDPSTQTQYLDWLGAIPRNNVEYNAAVGPDPNYRTAIYQKHTITNNEMIPGFHTVGAMGIDVDAVNGLNDVDGISKSTFSALSIGMYSPAQGQRNLLTLRTDAFGMGDCQNIDNYIQIAGGISDWGGEGYTLSRSSLIQTTERFTATIGTAFKKSISTSLTQAISKSIDTTINLTTSSSSSIGSPVLTFLSVPSGVCVGMKVTGNGVKENTTVVSFTSTTITLSQGTGGVASGVAISVRGYQQRFGVSNTTNVAVGDWITIEGGLPTLHPTQSDGFRRCEAVRVIAFTSNTITAVIDHDHPSGSVVLGAQVVQFAGGSRFGQGRLLINRSTPAYQSGLCRGRTPQEGVSRVITGTGTSWSQSMVGGNNYCIGAIALSGDTRTDTPFSVGNPLEVWYPIASVDSATELQIYRAEQVGQGFYYGGRQTVNGGYAIRPGCRILKFNPDNNRYCIQAVLEPNSFSWNAGDQVECPTSSSLDVSGNKTYVAVYSSGQHCASAEAYVNFGFEDFLSCIQVLASGYGGGWKTGVSLSGIKENGVSIDSEVNALNINVDNGAIGVADFASLPSTGTPGVLYITANDNKGYRWNGSGYIPSVVKRGTIYFSNGTYIRWNPAKKGAEWLCELNNGATLAFSGPVSYGSGPSMMTWQGNIQVVTGFNVEAAYEWAARDGYIYRMESSQPAGHWNPYTGNMIITANYAGNAVCPALIVGAGQNYGPPNPGWLVTTAGKPKIAAWHNLANYECAFWVNNGVEFKRMATDEVVALTVTPSTSQGNPGYVRPGSCVAFDIGGQTWLYFNRGGTLQKLGPFVNA